MSNKIKIRSLFKDKKAFKEIPLIRKGVISEASESPLNKNNTVNSTANFLHPQTQSLVVKQVAEISNDTRAYILTPDTSLGTAKLAYFRPGQSISFTLNIGNAVVTRSYVIASSPERSLDDEYMIIVKKKLNGFASHFIFNNWRKGTKITASAPFGDFYYQPLRDSKSIVGICDNDGFPAFLSLAEAIADGTLNVDLTLLYTARKEREALMSQRFDELSHKCGKFKIIYTFSDEFVENKERGFVTKSLIEKYAPKGKYSVFVYGNTALYNRAVPQIAELKLENKYIRFGPGGQIENPSSLSDFPQEAKGLTFLCKIVKNGEQIATIPCAAEETLLIALEKEGIAAPALCRSGECGFCRARLTKGNVFIPSDVDYRRLADSSYGIIHPCCSYPMSNLTLIIN
ncbi:MAG: 2Fe-2S iron-sulfur cluster binding domain-containing protein [Clostridia bacterium]|nr:2Fe-2S iron-sulfur cluster binding domain-containing protein [Clostridia bacterium]